MDNRIFEFLNKSYKNSTEVKIVSLLKKELDKLKEEAHLNYLKNFLVKNEKLLEKNTSEEFSQNFKDIIYKSEILKEMNYPKKIKLIKDLFNYKGENFEKEPFYIAKKGDILEWSEEDGCYTKDGICINGVESAGYIALKENLKVGTKVVHPKYGKGIVIKDTEGLCKPNESFVKFENSTGRVVPNGGLTGQGATTFTMKENFEAKNNFYVTLDDGSKHWYTQHKVEDIPNVYFAIGVNGSEKGEVYIHKQNALRPLFNKYDKKVKNMPQYAGKEGKQLKEITTESFENYTEEELDNFMSNPDSFLNTDEEYYSESLEDEFKGINELLKDQYELEDLTFEEWYKLAKENFRLEHSKFEFKQAFRASKFNPKQLTLFEDTESESGVVLISEELEKIREILEDSEFYYEYQFGGEGEQLFFEESNYPKELEKQLFEFITMKLKLEGLDFDFRTQIIGFDNLNESYTTPDANKKMYRYYKVTSNLNEVKKIAIPQYEINVSNEYEKLLEYSKFKSIDDYEELDELNGAEIVLTEGKLVNDLEGLYEDGVITYEHLGDNRKELNIAVTNDTGLLELKGIKYRLDLSSYYPIIELLENILESNSTMDISVPSNLPIVKNNKRLSFEEALESSYSNYILEKSSFAKRYNKNNSFNLELFLKETTYLLKEELNNGFKSATKEEIEIIDYDFASSELIITFNYKGEEYTKNYNLDDFYSFIKDTDGNHVDYLKFDKAGNEDYPDGFGEYFDFDDYWAQKRSIYKDKMLSEFIVFMLSK